VPEYGRVIIGDTAAMIPNADDKKKRQATTVVNGRQDIITMNGSRGQMMTKHGICVGTANLHEVAFNQNEA